MTVNFIGRNQPPSWQWEVSLRGRGYSLIAGIDEVGRGPLAGPVMAGAVVLPLGMRAPWLASIRDSKQLTPRTREVLSEKILGKALAIGIGSASPEEVDDLGIVPATRLAMSRAVSQLPLAPEYLLIDALKLHEVDIPQAAVIHGDCISISIASASIVAKVARDRLMERMDSVYPGFGFARNKGYGTPEHFEALGRLGPSPIHRFSFSPLSTLGGATTTERADVE